MARSKASSIFRFKSSCPADTARLAGLFARVLRGGDALFLEGPIGSGKTFFVRELALALGARRLPVSASFNLMRAYGGRLKLYHFDLFRAGEADMENIGLDEYLGRTDGITAVEWPEAAGELGARGAIKIGFSLTGGDSRLISVSAGADNSVQLEKIEALWLKK
ncbi:MAG TPA: tRNA (adenosine(37)-N6)-threonylcarbamoyltransferase complex ATPase subunit type 1 TsaE [Elusimicrobia bacterium]|nr:MAG: tRNA (adenosine(37)-N6)-threonylcarbamoyltransferase complex ATPase subunit type 1 TsaE [Elusimicrobia bacterium GWA2_64_40]HAN04224.1 tRNA (adenosine(37)-N6)-threonylcarbamoyltransferase complex ATPase subunit type 1 TsaE [Elusimicrobiota bacterium]HAU90134.1 tRNA (adenosine(37)-N6)-threonylcarbamoyltransferase complex ATPase subunit type 1 TsaE [Elusimicrobiota bacterium]